jgi:hypothetical protein
MRKWITYFYAKSNTDGEIHRFSGEVIEAPTHELAQQICNIHHGHLFVDGELILDVPANGLEADFKNKIDYEKIQQN